LRFCGLVLAVSDRESFQEPRNRARVIHEAAKLARSKAVSENQVMRAVLRGMRVTSVTFAHDRNDGACVQVEGDAWFDRHTAEAFERILNELRNEAA
jgi:Tfp pilus assembly protein FimT